MSVVKADAVIIFLR